MVNEVIKHYGYKEKAEQIFVRAGIQPVPQVNAPETAIHDLSMIPDTQLASIYGGYESYVGYISYCRAKRNCDLIVAERSLMRGRQDSYLKHVQGEDKKPTAKIIDILVDQEFREVEDEIMQLEVDVKLLDAILKDAEGKAKALSREITTRTAGTNLRQNQG